MEHDRYQVYEEFVDCAFESTARDLVRAGEPMEGASSHRKPGLMMAGSVILKLVKL